MKINRATESINYRQFIKPDAEPSRKFLRNSAAGERGIDIVEISEEARLKFLKTNPLERRMKSLNFAPDIISAVKLAMNDAGNNFETSRACLEELHARISKGEYDFDGEVKLAKISDIALSSIL